MTKLTLILSSFLILSSCFNKKHEVQSIKIIGDSPSMNNQIEVCLKEGIGYSNYTLKLNFTLNNNINLSYEHTLISQGGSDKKCFEFYVNSFSHRHTKKDENEKIEQIFSGNVKKLEVELYNDKREKIFSKKFNSL